MNHFIHMTKKKQKTSIALALVVLAFIAYGYRCGIQKMCGATLINSIIRDEATITMPNGKMIEAEVADTPESRERGLSSRKGLPDNRGLLFVFDEPGHYSFWMKDMKFPIDIVWIDDEGFAVNVENNVSPETYFGSYPPKVFTNSPPARYVLELAGGEAEKDGIYLGTRIAIAR